MSEPAQPGEYDRRAQAWVKNHFGVVPDLGSVEFCVDAAAYTSAAWCDFDVSWKEDGYAISKTLSSEAWNYDATDLIRELTETEPLAPEEAAR